MKRIVDEKRNGRGDRAVPRKAEEQESPEPERMQRPAEEAGAAPWQLEDPPQAEGDRDEEED